MMRPRLLFLLLGWSLLFTACSAPEEGGQTPAPHTPSAGGQAPQDDPRPGGTDLSYSPERNLVNPNRITLLEKWSILSDPFFNPAFLTAQQITGVNITAYSDAFNELKEGMAITPDLLPSARLYYEFSSTGLPTRYALVHTIGSDVADSMNMVSAYDDAGRILRQTVSGTLSSWNTEYAYDNGQLSSEFSDNGMQVSYAYDPAKKRRYETHIQLTNDGRSQVVVYGQPGDFPDEAMVLELQDEIFSRASAFVDYTNGPNLQDVDIFVAEGERIHRHYALPVNGQVGDIYDYNYHEDGSLKEKRFRWDETNAFRFREQYEYAHGNLVRVLYTDRRVDSEDLTHVERFEYDDRGRLTRRTTTEKRGNQPVVVKGIEVYAWK